MDRGRAGRARLLRAAAELIVERGWDAIDARALAERAGVTPEMVRYHFTSVQALLAEAATAAMRELFNQLTPALGLAGSPGVALALVLGFLCDDNGDNGQDRASLLFAEACLAATRDESLRQVLDQILRGFRYQLAVVFGVHGVAAPEATAAVLSAAVDGVLLHRALNPDDLDEATVEPVLHRMLTPSECSRGESGG
jgi:AcrR family transcriptional regulator